MYNQMSPEKENILANRKKELSIKYNLNFDLLEKEQLAFAKKLVLKDLIDLSHISLYGAIEVIFLKNKLLCSIIVCNTEFEIVDKSYVLEKVTFPYFPGFRNYRELPIMISAFEKLHEKPDVFFISGQGIIHPRLGLASHFGLVTGIPTIGVSNSIIDCEIPNEKDGAFIFKQGKKVGNILLIKSGSNPLYISPGNNISVESSYELSKKLIKLPHKRPEPIHIAGKYAKKVKEELQLSP